MKHIEGEESSCWPLKAQTCDCCLYLEEQKGMDVVKGRRQLRLKYSADSCSSGDSAHCGGPACDVSGKGSAGGKGGGDSLACVGLSTCWKQQKQPGFSSILLDSLVQVKLQVE